MSEAQRDQTKATREGTEIHSLLATGDKNPDYQSKDWETLGVNRDLGDGRRPDLVIYKTYGEQTQQAEGKTGVVVVIDYYTGSKEDVQGPGGPESLSHYNKGWGYADCPEIKSLVDQGYEYQYVGSNARGLTEAYQDVDIASKLNQAAQAHDEYADTLRNNLEDNLRESNASKEEIQVKRQELEETISSMWEARKEQVEQSMSLENTQEKGLSYIH